MEISQIIELMKAVSDNGLTDFSYEENGVALKMKKHPEAKIVAAPAAAPGQVYAAIADASAQDAGSADSDDDSNVIKSPLVGTF